VIVTAVAAAILGDNLGFFIGRRGGRRLAERHGWRVGLTPERLVEFDGFFQRHGPKTVFAARFITGLRVVGAVLAGGSGMKWLEFLFFNATGAVVWCTAIATAGYSLAYSWATLERWIGRSGLVALALVAAVGIIWVMRARRNHQT
jgi:membrane protein DedA with SNARE-associated domain